MNDSSRLIGKFCGKLVKNDYTVLRRIRSTSNCMYIKFSSDKGVSGKGVYAVFATDKSKYMYFNTINIII